MNSFPAAIGSQEAGFTQPSLHPFLHVCITGPIFFAEMTARLYVAGKAGLVTFGIGIGRWFWLPPARYYSSLCGGVAKDANSESGKGGRKERKGRGEENEREYCYI